MSRSRGSSHRVWWLASLALLACTLPADAQVLYESARHSLGLSPDPIARSPRLLGMGRLTLAEDLHNRITLWDFAENPGGMLAADSTSTLAIRPGTASRSGTHRQAGNLREYVAAREVRMGFEAWNRTAGTSAFGFYGDLGSLRLDRPYSDDLAVTGNFQVPRVVGIINGRMPYVTSGRMGFSIRAIYEYESDTDEYRTIFRNPTGEYISKEGVLVGPPDFFTPDERSASTLGGGGGISYLFGPWLTVALHLDGTSTRIEGHNEEARYFTGTGEDRPYIIGQSSLIGRIGAVEWGADGRGWRSDSHVDWVHTLAGGIGQQPFSGRGLFLTRDEEGTSMRARVRWALERLELGGSFRTSYRKIGIQAPDPGDRSSFNHFRNTATYRTGLDSLAFPDSVSTRESQERTYELAGGGSFRLPLGLLGAELHRVRERLDQTTTGAGPERKSWDARVGFERACTAVMMGRLGYIYRDEDLDELTKDNEFKSHTVTAGAGLKPAGSTWTFDLGYAFEWVSADYGNPTDPRETRQQASAQIRWGF